MTHSRKIRTPFAFFTPTVGKFSIPLLIKKLDVFAKGDVLVDKEQLVIFYPALCKSLKFCSRESGPPTRGHPIVYSAADRVIQLQKKLAILSSKQHTACQKCGRRCVGERKMRYGGRNFAEVGCFLWGDSVSFP